MINMLNNKTMVRGCAIFFQLEAGFLGRLGSNHGLAMMTSANGNIFRVTGPLCREFASHR